MGKCKTAALIVGLLTLIGAVLRFWKIGFGLPYIFYSDEALVTYIALNMGGGDLNPHSFIHPNLFHYLLLFLDVLYILGGMALGIFHKPSEAWQLYRTNPTVFYVIGRMANALFGTLTIPVVYWAGKKVFNKETGLLAALFLTFSPMHIQWSQLAYVDVPLTFFVTLAFIFSFLAFEKGSIRSFVLSGFTCGLAGSTKWQGFVALLWGPLASLLFTLKNKTSILTGLLGKRTIVYFLFFSLTFVVISPFLFLDFSWFRREIVWLWGNLQPSGRGQLGYEGSWNWFYYLFGPMAYGLGLPVEVLGILGLLVLVFRMDLRRLFFVSFPVVYFLIVGASRLRIPKYILPASPFFCISAAFFIVWLLSKAAGEDKRRLSLGLAMVGFLVVLPSALDSLRYAYLKTQPDTRQLVYEWVRGHIPPQSKILRSYYVFLIPDFAPGPKVEPLDKTVFDQRVEHRPSLKTLDEYRKEGFQYIIFDEWHMGMVLEEGGRERVRRPIVEQYRNFLKELSESSRLIAVFSPYKREDVSFEVANVELANRYLWKMKNLGPTIWVYEL